MENINQPDYKYYVVKTFESGAKKIQTGWEYYEDSKDALKDTEGSNYVVYNKKTLKALNIDPDDNSNWGETESKQEQKFIRGGLSQETYKLLIRRTKEGKAKYNPAAVEKMIREGREFGHMNDEEMNDLLLELNGEKEEKIYSEKELIGIMELYSRRPSTTPGFLYDFKQWFNNVKAKSGTKGDTDTLESLKW